MRLLVDARGSFCGKIVEKIVERSGGDVSLALSFGDREDDFHAPCLQRLEVRYGRSGHLIREKLSRGSNIPLLASPNYFWLLERGVEQLHRNSGNYRYRSHNLNHIQDYLDYYHILFDAYAQEIERRNVTHALFMNIPHLGYDVVLYDVAKALKIPTLVVSQTFFPDCFFSTNAIESFGSMGHDGPSGTPVQIEKGTAPDLFYMDKAWQKPAPKGRIIIRDVLSVLKHIAIVRPRMLLKVDYVLEVLRRVSQIKKNMADWRDPFASFFHVNSLAFFEHLIEYDRTPANFDVPFVYFPLHNQPEMSTQSLGGVFRDQLLAIEAVASVLPDGWKIYVKENPRQGAYARGPFFFHRLNRIKGVQLVPSETSTYELSTHAQITATVTGTAGYEALRKGRPTLVFGRPWYRDFPGVHVWDEGIDLERIARSTFEHAELEKAMGRLMARCHPGIIESIFVDQTNGFDEVENNELVADQIIGLLRGQLACTFVSDGTEGLVSPV